MLPLHGLPKPLQGPALQPGHLNLGHSHDPGGLHLGHPPVVPQQQHLPLPLRKLGQGRPEGQPLSQRKCASLRVSNMVSVELLQQKASFTAAQRREVERKIREVGVQFLVEEPCLIRVKMSKDGKKKYAGMSTMRPPCSKREGDEWEFYCSQRQALWYFSRMARDCEILEPKQLRRDMIRYLKKSLENYPQSCT